MKRLKSLDVMRGLTVALMILVNNGGEHNYHILEHSKWNGLTPCDLVFPFFLFMMGMSTYLSLKKSAFQPSTTIYRKIAKRTCLLFLIGLGRQCPRLRSPSHLGSIATHRPLLRHRIDTSHHDQPSLFHPHDYRFARHLHGHHRLWQWLCL